MPRIKLLRCCIEWILTNATMTAPIVA